MERVCHADTHVIGARALLALLVVGAGCGGGSGEPASQPGGAPGPIGTDGAGVDAGTAAAETATDSLAAVAGIAGVDRRPDLLSELGGPDAFVITAGDVAGEISRLESWMYYSAATQIDLIDGEVLWTMPLDALPDGSLLPLSFEPTEFELLGSVDDTLGALPGVDLTPISAAADLEIPGAEVYAGEQLVLAFVDDALVYVEAFALAPTAPLEVDE